MSTSAARRAPVFAVVLAAFAILAVSLMHPPHGVPLYDGVGFPDEPYRYVHPPAGAKATPPPTSATATTETANGSNTYAFYADSAEMGPQISVFVAPRSVVVPSSVTKITFRADPMAPDRQPAGATIDGNVYRLRAAAVVTGGQDAGLSATASSQVGANGSIVTMRATSAHQPHPDFFYRETPAAGWHEIDTVRIGNDIYRTDLVGFGDYALAWKSNSGRSRTGGFSSSSLFIAVPVVLVAGAIIAIRRTRRRST